jgi:rubrerythrin
MDVQTLKKSQDPVVVIESLMAQEREDLEQHRTNAFAATEPKLQSLFARLADIHSGIYAELRLLHDELQSRKVITEQINDMFR